jgi:hypothetical protein
MKSLSLLGVTLLSLGCATHTTSPGHLDAELLSIAASAQGVRKLEMHSEKTGEIWKLSVYHQDAARIPEPIRKLAESTFPGSKALSFETERYADAGLVYEVEVEKADGEHCEISTSPDGKLRYAECRLTQAALPSSVSKTIADMLPGGTVEEIEILKGQAIVGGEEYRAEVKVGPQLHYLRIKPSGELIRHGLLIPAKIEVPAR